MMTERAWFLSNIGALVAAWGVLLDSPVLLAGGAWLAAATLTDAVCRAIRRAPQGEAGRD